MPSTAPTSEKEKHQNKALQMWVVFLTCSTLVWLAVRCSGGTRTVGLHVGDGPISHSRIEERKSLTVFRSAKKGSFLVWCKGAVSFPSASFPSVDRSGGHRNGTQSGENTAEFVVLSRGTAVLLHSQTRSLEQATSSRSPTVSLNKRRMT